MTASHTKSSIVFRFIRNNSKDGSTDDIAIISYAGNSTYKLSFKTYFTENTKKKATVMTLDDRQTFRWVRRMVSLLECDTDPFTGIQVDMPMMPTVLLTVENLGRDYSSLLDSVEFQLDNWSNTVCTNCDVQKVPNAPARRTLYQDEYNDYATMPPLIPIEQSSRTFLTPPRVNRHHMFFDEE
jgi:hypothetical protein